jgi:hypothetical protein
MEEKEVNVGELLPDKFESRRAFRFVMTLKDVRTGEVMVEPFLIKCIKINPPANYLWFQMYVPASEKLQDYINLYNRWATAKVQLLSPTGEITDTIGIQKCQLRLLPIEMDYSEAEPLLLTFESA